MNPLNLLPTTCPFTIPTVASWRAADVIQTTLGASGTVAEAVERLATSDLIPQAWADAMSGGSQCAGPSRFARTADADPRRVERHPTPSLLLALSSWPERIDEAERLVRGALASTGSAPEIIWYPVPWGETRPHDTAGLGMENDRILASLGIVAGGLREGAVFLGVPEACPVGQKVVARHFVSLLLGPGGFGFGDLDSRDRETVLHSLLRSNRIPYYDELHALFGFVPTDDCLGALQVFLEGLPDEERELLVNSVPCFGLADNANIHGAMAFAGLCLEEVIRTQKALAKRSRETVGEGGREEYARWLKDRGQDKRAYWYQSNVHRPKMFPKRVLFALDLKRSRRRGYLWSPSQLTALWDSSNPAVDFSPYPEAKHYEKAIDEFALKIAPKWEGALELKFSHPSGSKVNFDPLERLVQSGAIRAIQELRLDSLATLSLKSIRMLAQSPASDSLRFLSLEDTNIDDESAIALSRSPYLNRLEFLSLKGTKVGSKGIAALVGRTGGLPSLKRLVY